MRILLIEDNPDHVFLARQAVEQTWHSATLDIAHDMQDVRSRYCHKKPRRRFDLVLVSLDSRDTHRLQQLRELQACRELNDAPVIALASSTRNQELAQVANQPIEWIILKPLRAEALQEAIKRRPLP